MLTCLHIHTSYVVEQSVTACAELLCINIRVWVWLVVGCTELWIILARVDVRCQVAEEVVRNCVNLLFGYIVTQLCARVVGEDVELVEIRCTLAVEDNLVHSRFDTCAVGCCANNESYLFRLNQSEVETLTLL